MNETNKEGTNVNQKTKKNKTADRNKYWEKRKVNKRGQEAEGAEEHMNIKKRAVMLAVYVAWAEGQMICETVATTPLPQEVTEFTKSLRTVVSDRDSN